MEFFLLSTVQSFLQIKKEVPDAVGYDTYGPISFPVPKEFKELPTENHDGLDFISLTSIRVDNYSSKVQKEIRVLYTGDFQYQPIFKFHRRDVSVKCDLKGGEKELIIEEIPPNESVSIEISYPSSDFEIVQVLSGNSEITSLMQKLAEARRHPELARMKLIMYATIAFATISIPVVGYFSWHKIQENARIEAAYSDFASCSPSLMVNPPENEKMLERKFNKLTMYWQNYILSSNKVYSLQELKLKDELVWCEPNQP